jgi:hypothetical protein
MRGPAPDLQDPNRGSFEPYRDVPEPVPIEITGNVVEDIATRLSGGAGPGSTDAVDLENWLLRFGAESEILRDSLSGLAKWLANDHPPWAAYRALMACRLVALDKSPGMRPVGIGEVDSPPDGGHQAMDAAGHLNAQSTPCGRPLKLPPSRPSRPNRMRRSSRPERTRWRGC